MEIVLICVASLELLRSIQMSWNMGQSFYQKHIFENVIDTFDYKFLIMQIILLKILDGILHNNDKDSLNKIACAFF